jgi:cell division protein ZapA (FtsZ GTPase activity inhibitor)
MDDKLSIRVNIAEQYYPLKVSRNEEERIRKAAKLINDKLLQYKQTYSEKDIKDFLAMVSLHFTSRFLEIEEQMNQTPIKNELSGLNEEIEDYLNNIK